MHLAGLGDGCHGLIANPKWSSLWHPVLNLQRRFYLNASCSCVAGQTVDDQYVKRLAALVANMPTGFKAMLFAFDWCHNEDGRPVLDKSTFYIPDSYAANIVAAHPQLFEWAASIHPYRPDAVTALENAAAAGAKALKWLPAAQNIDPDSPKCDAMYAALARLKLPLISHSGAEKATMVVGLQHLGNPLKLRRALAAGVRVVIAHCASHGTDEDLDHPGTRQQSFTLFSRLMDSPEGQENLIGDLAAITLLNRKTQVLKTILERKDWHARLCNGSDYPLPGIFPIIWPTVLARAGLLPADAVPVLTLLRQHNPLYFDLAVKRLLSWQGQSFPASVFETRKFFQRPVL
jgi:mannonate dehydratase